MQEDLFLKDFHQSEDLKLTEIKQYQMSIRPDRIQTFAFKLQLVWDTLKCMHWTTKGTFSKPSSEFLPGFEEPYK